MGLAVVLVGGGVLEEFWLVFCRVSCGIFIRHNLLMTIDNLLMLKKFWGILPLLNYF